MNGIYGCMVVIEDLSSMWTYIQIYFLLHIPEISKHSFLHLIYKHCALQNPCCSIITQEFLLNHSVYSHQYKKIHQSGTGTDSQSPTQGLQAMSHPTVLPRITLQTDKEQSTPWSLAQYLLPVIVHRLRNYGNWLRTAVLLEFLLTY